MVVPLCNTPWNEFHSLKNSYWFTHNILVIPLFHTCKECKISKMIKYLNLSLENPMDGGAWKTAVHGVAEGRTRLSDFTFTFHFHALEKEMATHSSVLAWRIPGTAEPGGLSSMGSHRVGHNWSDLEAAAAAEETLLCWQRHYFVAKVCLIKAMVFSVVMYGCESWTIKKAEYRRIDAFELWCWRKLLRVPWT